MSSLVLMENAGRGCADVLCQIGCRGQVAVVCGKGNNAGDGFVIARHLDLRGVPVRVVLLEHRPSCAAMQQRTTPFLPAADLQSLIFQSNLIRPLSTPNWSAAEWIVDALLGTGSTGASSTPF